MIAAAVAVFVAGLAVRGGGESAAATVTPTWDDVAPVFASKCASCHQLGGVAPFSLTSALSAQSYAKAILRRTQNGTMPPWMPGPTLRRCSARRAAS